MLIKACSLSWLISFLIINLYGFLKLNIQSSSPDPSHLRRASRSASPMKCLPEGNTLDERTNFYRSMDEKSYYLEVV